MGEERRPAALDLGPTSQTEPASGAGPLPASTAARRPAAFQNASTAVPVGGAPVVAAPARDAGSAGSDASAGSMSGELTGPEPGPTADGQTMAVSAPAASPRGAGYYRLTPGARFGPCTILRPLGRGGMGEVWLARNEVEKRDEALKVLLSVEGSERERSRFIREGQAAMALGDAPEVVRTYDVASEGGRLYIRMELVEGVSLDRLPRLEPAAYLELFKKMARALAAGHRRGIVHRDVKPSNFMLAASGTVKLMDFGLARPEGVMTLTATGEAMGTPTYMSPEQWSDSKRADFRSDVFSLGVTFYHLLTDSRPFVVRDGGNPQAYAWKVMHEDPTPIEPRPGLHPELPNLILTCMAKRPAERFADAMAVVEALERIESDPGSRIAPPASERVRERRRWLARRTGLALIVAAVAAAAVGGWLIYSSHRSLAGAEAGLEEARVALRDAEDRAAGGADAEATAAIDRALARLGAAGEAASLARERGADAASVDALLGRVEAERTVAALLRASLTALAERRPRDAEAALARAAALRGDEGAFAGVRGRAGRAAASAAQVERALALEAKDAVEALRVATEARAGALEPPAVEDVVRRLAARAAAERAQRAKALRDLIATGSAAGLDAAAAGLAELDRYPGGREERGALETLLAETRRRAEVAGRAGPALAAARAAEALGRPGRADAILEYQAVLAELRGLEGAERAELERTLELDAAAVARTVRRLETEERVDAALDRAREPGRAGAALAELCALAGEVAGREDAAELGPRVAAAVEEARRLARAEAAKAVEAALARGDGAAIVAAGLEAVRLSPGDARLRDLVRYGAALAAPAPAGRVVVIVPPATVSLPGRADTYVAPFAIDRHEVSNAEFAGFVERGGYGRADLFAGVPPEGRQGFLREGTATPGPLRWGEGRGFPAERALEPVATVSLHEARACARERGGRLPSPEEWAVAAGYDPQTRSLRTFPWGEAADAARTRLTGTATVAVDSPALDVSPLGVVGLGGNVREWVEVEGGAVLGGSAWSRGKVDDARVAAAPARWNAERRDVESVGFRCAYTLPEPPELAAIPTGGEPR